MKKKFGFIFLGLAICIWIITPFVGLMNKTGLSNAIFIPIIVVVGELFFLLSIWLMGKEVWIKIKWIVKKYWRYFKLKYLK